MWTPKTVPSYTSHITYRYISKDAGDPIIEWKICERTGIKFPIFESEATLYTRLAPTYHGTTFPIPSPTICPEERQRQRLARRNDRHLYRRTCDATWEQIISVYSPKTPYKVYNQSYRRSDKRDAITYGKSYTSEKYFFDQFQELMLSVPHSNIFSTNCEDCDYTNYTINSKWCYAVFGCTESLGCLFSDFIVNGTQVYDSISVFNSTHCYQGIASENCTSCQYFKNCSWCSDCFGISYCTNCNHCIGCTGLQDKSYYIFNIPVTKEDFEHYRSSLSSREQRDVIFKKAQKLALPPKITTLIHCKNSYGDMLVNSTNALFCYDCNDVKSVFYTANAPHTQSSSDIDYAAPAGTQRCYNMWTSCWSQDSIWCMLCWYCTSVFYCLECHNCSNCFWCVWLRNKEYCILNKQYTPKVYEKTVALIIKSMSNEWTRWQFLPQHISPFAYNETLAHDYYPVTPEQQKNLQNIWYRREDLDPAHPLVTKHVKAAQLPDTIAEVSDDILTFAILCKETWRPFRILPQELVFYRNMHIPLPHLHPEVRHTKRLQQKNPRHIEYPN